MRLAGRQRLGFYPLPIAEAERIRSFLRFPDGQCSALDPCIGDGAAFASITLSQRMLRYGIELEAGRAEQARSKGIEVIHGNCFDVRCPVESFSLIYLNPPYEFEIGQDKSQRMEKLFLEHIYRWLKFGGILVLIAPAKRIADCAVLLSIHFRDTRVYRLTEPECVRYQQVMLIGVRRTRQERDRLRDSEIIRVQLWLGSLETELQGLPPLPSEPDHLCVAPPGGPARLVHRGLPLDQPAAEIVGLSPGLRGAFRTAGRRDWPPAHALARGARWAALYGRNAQWDFRGRGSAAHRALAVGKAYRQVRRGRGRKDMLGTQTTKDVAVDTEQDVTGIPLIETTSARVEPWAALDLALGSSRPRSSKRSTTATPDGQLTLF